MVLKFQGDKILWYIYVFFVVTSIFEVFSATEALGLMKGSIFMFIVKHVIMMLFGFGLMFFVHKLNYTIHYLLAYPFLLISVVLLFLTLFSGVSLNQASRWLVIPGTNFTLQTSDVAKFALVNYIAAAMYNLNGKGKVKEFKSLFPVIFATIVVVALIFPSNLSTAIMVFVIAYILMWIGGARIKHLLITFLVFALLGLGFIMIAPKFMKHTRVSTWKNRIEAFFSDDNSKDKDKTFQADQAKIAIATGGLLGKGPGRSTQKSVLPHPYSDFIFAIILEEYGLEGGIFVMLLYLILFFRYFIKLVKAQNMTYKILLQFGIVLVFVIQAFINMGVAVGIFPVTGQPLPLISMGGTSYIMSSISFGVLISTTIDKKKKEKNKKVQSNENEEE
jgi:cell division protein FtsW